MENPEINVLLGGGQRNFYPNSTALPTDETQTGLRDDGQTLSEMWLDKQREKGRSAEYARYPGELYTKAAIRPDYLLGMTARIPIG